MAKEGTTRYYSDIQEKSVCRALDAQQQPNSGAGLWRKGDCRQTEASLLIECKTCEKDQNSFAIKKDWIDKNRQEAYEVRLDSSCIAFNFGPNRPNYYVIDESLMRFLVDKLIEDRETNGY